MNGALARCGFHASIALAFVAPGLFAGALPAFRDFLVLVVPMRFHAARAVASGELPLWTTDLFLGAPFLANYQSAVLYPPSLLVYVLPEPIGLSAFLGFHVALAGLGMDAFLRAREGISARAALFGGATYAAGGFFASLLPLTNHLEAAAWMPWILLAAERFAASRSTRPFVALTVLLALQLLTGAPETVLLTGILIAALLPRAVAGVGEGVRSFAGIAAAAALAAAACAVQLLPTLEYVTATDRRSALPFEEVAAESLEPRSLQQLVLPHRFTDGAPDLTPEGGVPLVWSIYLGAAPLVFLFAGAPSAVWLLVLLFGLVFSLGPHLPALAAAYSLVPGVVGLFRFPAKFFLVCHVALAVLASRGLEQVLGVPAARRRALRVTVLFSVAAIALAAIAPIAPAPSLALLGYDLRPDLTERVAPHLAAGVSLAAVRFAAWIGVAAVLCAVAHRHPRWREFAIVILAAATAVDLVSVHRPLLGYADARILAEPVPETLGLRAGERVFHYCREEFGCKPPGAPGIGTWRGTLRVAVPIEEQAAALSSALVPNLGGLRGIGAIGGTDGFVTGAQRALWNALVAVPPPAAARILAALGVAALVGREAIDGVPVSFARGEPALVVHRLGGR